MIRVKLNGCHLDDVEQREWRMSNYLTRKFNQCHEDLITAFNDFDRRRKIYNKTMRVGKRGSYRKANRHWSLSFTIE